MFTEGASLKMRGFDQELWDTSSTRKETVGTLRITEDGRMFRYAKAGGSDLSPGKLNFTTQIVSGHTNIAVATSAAIGENQVVVTATAGTAIVANALNGGYLQVNDATGEGYQYLIAGNTAISASGTTVYLGLSEAIRVALVAGTSEITLVHNNQYYVVESATEENVACGVPLKAVTTEYYFWNQVWGPGIGLMDTTPDVGCMLIPGSAAGEFANAATASQATQNIVGRQGGTVGVDGEYQPIFLMIG